MGCQILSDVLYFYKVLRYYTIWGGGYENCPKYESCSSKDNGDSTIKQKRIAVHLFFLCLNLKLWSEPHYRHGTYQDDMKANLRNVAIPGTGIPLSVFASNKLFGYCFLFIGYPLACVLSAFNAMYVEECIKGKEGSFSQYFHTQLLEPEDWFNFWRTNCELTSWHALLTKSNEYDLEDKFKFLQTCEQRGIAVSPSLNIEKIVCKDKNEEGGLGIHFYNNSKHGGRWIIQEVLKNDAFVSTLLPKEDVPLSTVRVITASEYSIDNPTSTSNKIKIARQNNIPVSENFIKVMSHVFRAGRQGAKTDHVSVLFDIDGESGSLKKATTNDHWYKLGFWNAVKLMTNTFHMQEQHDNKKLYTASKHNLDHHPDGGIPISGKVFPDFEHMKQLCVRAHARLIPTVPLAGWDVCCTNKGILLLEVNLSCNFFRGEFDPVYYYDYLHRHIRYLEKLQSSLPKKEK